MGVLIFRIRDPAQGGAETNADAMLRCLRRIWKPGIIERHLRGRDRELGVTIQSFQPMRRKMILRNPIGNLSAAMRVEF